MGFFLMSVEGLPWGAEGQVRACTGAALWRCIPRKGSIFLLGLLTRLRARQEEGNYVITCHSCLKGPC